MDVALLVLNYNGRALLQQCLPSVVAAAARSRYACRVYVVDNDSRDDSCALLAAAFPQVGIIHARNRGLCSYNDVLQRLDCRVALLLNNDICLDPGAVDPLVEPLLQPPRAGQPPTFLTAPLCWQLDGRTCEGLKTAVTWRWGLVQATGRFPGHESVCHVPDETASAGAVMAVDRAAFVRLGGFDPLFLPGRLEDLDFCFRAFVAGYRARFVPQAVAYHHGAASFQAAFGADGCRHLALRNTLLFQWKNLRHPAHHLRQALGWLLRAVRDVLRAPWTGRAARFAFLRAWRDAHRRWREHIAARDAPPHRHAAHDTLPRAARLSAERAFFRRYHPRVLLRAAGAVPTHGDGARAAWDGAGLPLQGTTLEAVR
jgi:GT2 family glycosyltransferase